MADDPGLGGIDRLSTHYGGRPYPNRESPRVSAWMAVERWHGWGAVGRPTSPCTGRLALRH